MIASRRPGKPKTRVELSYIDDEFTSHAVYFLCAGSEICDTEYGVPGNVVIWWYDGSMRGWDTDGRDAAWYCDNCVEDIYHSSIEAFHEADEDKSFDQVYEGSLVIRLDEWLRKPYERNEGLTNQRALEMIQHVPGKIQVGLIFDDELEGMGNES